MKSRYTRILALIIVLVFLFLFPLLRPEGYWLSFLFILFMYIALSESWYIIGSAGYLSFGHVAFFGIGAYTTSLLLVHFGLSPFLTATIGGVLAASVAAIFGYPCLRLKGPYFTITTFCMALAIQAVVMNLELTGRTTGLWIPFLPFDIFSSRVIFYEVMLVLASATVFVTWWIDKSKFGLGLSSIREDEDTAQTLGVNATVLKMIAFMLSAFLVGIVGGIYAYYRSYVHPDMMFDVFISITMVLMALLGGRSWLGPVMGAVILTTISEVLTGFLGIPAEVSRIIYGLMLALVIMFMPNGIMSFVQRRRTLKRKEGLVSQPEV